MFLIKLLIWMLVYPLMFASFLMGNMFGWMVFLFNSPVDIWNIISSGVDEASTQ